MIYVFIFFFIFEITLVALLCANILALDKKVKNLTEKINRNRHTLKFKLRATYDVANKFKLWIRCQKREFRARKRSLIRKIVKALLVSVAVFLFQKTRFRKKFLLAKLLLVLYDTLRADCSI